jgi:hypothetical protein
MRLVGSLQITPLKKLKNKNLNPFHDSTHWAGHCPLPKENDFCTHIYTLRMSMGMGHMSAYMHGLHTYCKCIVYIHLENIYELIRSIKNIGDMYIYIPTHRGGPIKGLGGALAPQAPRFFPQNKKKKI